MEDVSSLSLYEQKFNLDFEDFGMKQWSLTKKMCDVEIHIVIFEFLKLQTVLGLKSEQIFHLKFDSISVSSDALADLINQFRKKIEYRFTQQLILNHLLFEQEKNPSPTWETSLDEGD
jgi:hypothetical protein